MGFIKTIMGKLVWSQSQVIRQFCTVPVQFWLVLHVLGSLFTWFIWYPLSQQKYLVRFRIRWILSFLNCFCCIFWMFSLFFSQMCFRKSNLHRQPFKITLICCCIHCDRISLVLQWDPRLHFGNLKLWSVAEINESLNKQSAISPPYKARGDLFKTILFTELLILISLFKTICPVTVNRSWTAGSEDSNSDKGQSWCGLNGHFSST